MLTSLGNAFEDMILERKAGKGGDFEGASEGGEAPTGVRGRARSAQAEDEERGEAQDEEEVVPRRPLEVRSDKHAAEAHNSMLV